MITGLSPMDELDEVVRAVKVPVQAVGGLSIRQAIECPRHGAPLVVLGAPLVIDADEFKRAGTDLHAMLQDDLRRDPPDADQRLRTGATEMPRTMTRSPARHDSAAVVSVRRSEPAASVELREVAVPEIGDDDVLLRGGGGVGVRIRRAPGVQHALLAGERPGHARSRVRRHDREGRARGARLSRRRPRRQRNRGRHLRRLPDVPHRPLQPVPDAQGLRLRRQRRDGAVRARCRRAACTTCPTRCRSTSRAWPSRTPSPTTRCASTSTIRPGDLVVVLGPGPIGLLCARMAALAGANPLVVVGLPADAPRLETARRARRHARRRRAGRTISRRSCAA